MKTNGWVASSQRLYRGLLHLYPHAYRESYEEEMFHLFTDQCREAHGQRGNFGMLALWFRTLADVGVTVIREHLSDPNARTGLLEAASNAPLPWKGVLLVLIPGLIFFISQVDQVISNDDWFFFAFYRAGYFLILPVLLAWLFTRRFPVWGLIPFGLFYETAWNYAQRFDPGTMPFIDHWLATHPVFLLGMSRNPYELKFLLMAIGCLILLSVLIVYSAYRRKVLPSAWKWLGLYGLLIVLEIVGEIYNVWSHWTIEEVRQVVFQASLWKLSQSLPFLILVFLGLFFARKYGGFTFLLLLGYLLPTILFGRYGAWSGSVPFYAVSLAVLVYRFVVALVAPIWLVRAASTPGRQRAVAIPIAIALVCHISLNLVVVVTMSGFFDYFTNRLDLILYLWDELIIAAGVGLAVVLYLPREAGQIAAPALMTTAE